MIQDRLTARCLKARPTAPKVVKVKSAPHKVEAAAIDTYARRRPTTTSLWI